MSNSPNPKSTIETVKFSDIPFTAYPEGGKVGTILLSNGFGLSIVQVPESPDGVSPESYGYSASLYEAAIIVHLPDGTQSVCKEGNLFGYLTEDAIMALLRDVAKTEPFDPEYDMHLVTGYKSRAWYDLAGKLEDFMADVVQGFKNMFDKGDKY